MSLFLILSISILSINSEIGSIICSTPSYGTYYNITADALKVCDKGTFYSNSTSSCILCPKGFRCQGFTAAPIQCSEGYYQNEPGQSECFECPSGFKCQDRSAAPVGCLAGTFSSLGQEDCSPCGIGQYSLSEQGQCVSCPEGKRCPSRSTTVECSAGEYSLLGEENCSGCEAGKHTDGMQGAKICKSCYAGYRCVSPAVKPSKCLEGSYSGEGDAQCFTCPRGSYCLDPAQPPQPCGPGTYSDDGQKECQQCPAGSSCLDKSMAPIGCEEGYYSRLGEEECKPCEAGFEVSSSSSDPTPCEKGTYSLKGDGSCTNCPAGFFCFTTFDQPVPCATGKTTNGTTRNTACFDCPSGFVCSDPAAEIVACGEGTYNPTGSSVCQPCPAGASCLNNQVEACPSGTYSIEGSSSCSECPPGSACPYPNQAVVFECTDGTYSIKNQPTCTICPAGYECPDTDTATSKECEDGYYSTGGQNKCTKCEPGKECLKADGSENSYCLPGFYSTGGPSICQICKAGFACPYTTSDISYPCSDGSYSGEGQQVCNECPPGFRCPENNVADGGIQPCELGTYSLGRQTECTKCPAGNFCPNPTVDLVQPCSPGSYSEGSSSSCKKCPAGEECKDFISPGEPCKDGYYSLGNQISCTLCPQGYRCPDKDLPPIICGSGSFSNPGSQNCDDCKPGYICEEGSISASPSNGVCPLGYYCESGETVPKPCEAGTYGPTTGLESKIECLECPAGYFCLEATKGFPPSLNTCPQGHYCPTGTKSKYENPCDIGKYGPLKGQQTKAVACIVCPEGRYCPQGSTSPDNICPRGHYCSFGTGPLGSTSPPTPCGPGLYTAEEGARMFSDCLDCPAGYYCPEGTSDPQYCPAGKYQPTIRAVSEDLCLDCNPGTACTSIALTSPNSPCSPGYYCPLGSSESNDPDHACPAGTFTDSYNLTSSDECQTCPIRFYCVKGTGGSNKAPAKCFKGHYCSNGTKYGDQRPCPAGSWSNRTDLASSDECWICPKGSYCPEGSTNADKKCPAGYYCPAGTKGPTSYPCSSGSFSNKTGNIREEDCDDCIQGYYCGKGTVDPLPCPPGSFNNQSKAADESSCQQCISGYYCPKNGTEEPQPCLPGQYSDEGKSNCDPCPPGKYCNKEKITKEDLRYKTCPAGMYCPEGTDEYPNLLNYKCPVGFYCPAGCPTPKPCRRGTFSSKTGLTRSDDCQLCTPGYYCDSLNSTEPTGPCPPGYYCLNGTDYAFKYPCRAGTFLSGTAAVSQESCTLCLSGYYCDSEGLSEPKDCPKGSYCIPGSLNPQKCGRGTYNNGTNAKNAQECTECPGGYYCEGTGNEKPTAQCWGGFYCISGSYTPTPRNGSIGDICPQGFFCPNGSAKPESCQDGKFVNKEGSSDESDCTNCTCGSFCSQTTNGPCLEGYYCTGGASTPIQFASQPGYYSKAGACDQIICSKGTYTPGEHFAECKICEEGQFCNETGMDKTTECPTGHYCPFNSISPKPCPIGTYNSDTGQSAKEDCDTCKPGFYCSKSGLPEPEEKCQAGFYCLEGSKTSTPEDESENGGPCPAGSYCESGTDHPDGIKCPPGTYNNETRATNRSFCRPCKPGEVCSKFGLKESDGICDPGFYCTANSTTSQPLEENIFGGPCPIGHRCPAGTGTPIPCEPGTFNEQPQQAFCDVCPAGYYCEGISNRTVCPIGFYCPNGTGLNWMSCPPGTYSDREGLSESRFCKPCDAGFYCDEFNLTLPYKFCEEGYFCRSQVNVSNPGTQPNSGDGGLCPAGNFCPENTGEPYECKPGTFNSNEGQNAEDDCKDCLPGKYCPDYGSISSAFNCSEGYFCCGKSVTGQPKGNFTDLSICPPEGGYRCPPGKYCPEGTTSPLDCPPGSYSDRSGLGYCDPCPAGYYCPEGIVDYSRYPCKAGYYCTEGTDDYLKSPCPPGFYSSSEMLTGPEQCWSCPPGKYCLGTGNTTYDGVCEPGFYCLINATGPRPVGSTNYTDSSSALCICPSEGIGGVCPIGCFCPADTGCPIPCSSGYFCNETGLSKVSGPCDAGFYCNSSADNPRPTDGITGSVCPLGYFCEKGTEFPGQCPRGTYGEGTGKKSISGCKNCTAGYYCPSLAQTMPVDDCPEGYYCPPGQSSGDNYPCEPGYYCITGSENQQLCPSGSYQDMSTSKSCKPCPAGFYCDKNDAPISDYSKYDCPLGSFCPQNSTSSTSNLCPPGRYGNKINLKSEEECEECPSGKQCPISGMVSLDLEGTANDCDGGSFCANGASSSVPDNSTVYECPIGQYCPSGITSPLDCPRGTFNNKTGQAMKSDCTNCTAGYFCDENKMSKPKGECYARYYCPPGSISPTAESCTVNHYCPPKSPFPLPCPEGTYNFNENAEVCEVCPSGQYCLPGGKIYDCPLGYYCPNGTGEVWSPCPAGTYGTSQGLKKETDCKSCDSGKYCEFLAANSTTGDCAEGFYCRNGSSSKQPPEDGYNGLCSKGNYCPEGTPIEIGCKSGTFSNKTGRSSQSQCLLCPPGEYCEEDGLTEPTGLCYGGFYCLGGATKPNNPVEDITGGPCPLGFRCPNGTSIPLSCDLGYYNNQTGQEKCFECPPGFYCPANTTDYSMYVCPKGHYCPEKTKDGFDKPCPPGTYNNNFQSEDIQGCIPCKAGMFCNESGLTEPVGLCAEGWYCSSCSWTSKPPSFDSVVNKTSCLCPVGNKSTSIGGICPAGYFCPEGSSFPQACPAGRFCNKSGLGNETSGKCQAGYHCINGSASPTPNDGTSGEICPVGYYCPEGTLNKKPCPPGTFSNHIENKVEKDCDQCSAGFYCNGGERNETGLCDEGYFCPSGQANGKPAEFVCPKGFKCPIGSAEAIPCDNGTYQDSIQQGDCDTCPAGFFCSRSVVSGTLTGCINPVPCIQGHYCESGTEYPSQYPCPPGSYSNKTNLENMNQCTHCEAGYYCSGGESSQSDLCSSRFYCKNSSASPTPNDGVTGMVCPIGSYCKAGTTYPNPCPIGTFGATNGLESVKNCTACTAGMACTEPGLTQPDANCTEGFYCPTGSKNTTAVPCDPGYFCPPGSITQQPCEFGSYTNESSQSGCRICEIGFYCSGTSIKPCNAGFYCPNGNTIIPCPAGKYGKESGLYMESQCSDCDPGFYCPYLNATSPFAECDEGHFCRNASISKNPVGLNGIQDNAGICPPGYFCPKGTGEPNACELGTFNPKQKANSSSDCLSCSSGMFCNDSALSEPTGKCSEGYYCYRGSTNYKPTSNDPYVGGICPSGTYCPEGTEWPKSCPGGSYGPQAQMSSCLICPEGSFCIEGSNSTEICPFGHFCETNSSSPQPCPAGTFRNETGGISVDSCFLCSGGFFCDKDGQTIPEKQCAAGWYCYQGSRVEKPSANNNNSCSYPLPRFTGGKCEAGFYCPKGSNEPNPCDSGFYCNQSGLYEVKGPCSAGYYCSSGSKESNPVDKVYGDICPSGFYCPEASKSPKPCLQGTFLNKTGGLNSSDCQECTAGFYCPYPGTSFPTLQCKAGYFCPLGSTEGSLESNKCPKGTRCPLGSGSFTPCFSGTYQSDDKQAECKVCPPGSYCNYLEAKDENLFGVVTPKPCPPGFYCPESTERSSQWPCPVGTYNPFEKRESEEDCLLCDPGKFCSYLNITEPSGNCSAGFYCPLNSTSPKEVICPQGSYCPEGSSYPYKCPVGTFGSSTKLTSLLDCSPCTPGSYCDEEGLPDTKDICFQGHYCISGSSSPNPIDEVFGDICSAGSYCPSNSSLPTPCPEGTYNPYQGKTSESDCLKCSEGYFCSGTGNKNYTGQCNAGYYCDGGAINATQHDCPPGYYCPENSKDAKPCQNGYYTNVTNMETCWPCPAGFFCVDASSLPIPCPKGHFCLEKTGYQWKRCPKGTFNPVEGSSELNDCLECTSGQYCNGTGMSSPFGPCDPGYECRSGVNTPKPDNITNTGNGGPCEAGYICTNGLAEQCPPGSFSSKQQQAICELCPPGSYCDGSSSIPVECQPGYFCPEGTKYADQYPCPPGTYNNETGQQDEQSGCTACPGGVYCPGEGNKTPKDLCDEGYYCTSSAISSKPHTFGSTNATFTNETCTTAFDCVCPALIDTTGGICQPGYFCPRGSSKPLQCTEGMYCPDIGASNPLANCSAGYFCNRGSTVANQNKCPPGHYCPSGSKVKCPPGSYSPSYGNKRRDDCLDCKAGMFCEGYGNTKPTGNCSLGYYCPGSNTNPEPDTYCEKHHKCPEGSVNQTVCEAGTYQDQNRRGSCISCEAGKLCDPYDGNLEPEPCPKGHFCLERTPIAQPCPGGTYRNEYNGASEDDCMPCDGGYFCRGGESSPSGPCDPGFYCTGGSNVSNPKQNEFDEVPKGNGICPAGYYCKNATIDPYPCPPGKYLDSIRNDEPSDCKDCPPGKFCPLPGMSDVNTASNCSEGYVCYGGSFESQPNDETGEPCPKGYYCPSGTSLPKGCPPGTYAPNLQMSKCRDCDFGFMCPLENMTNAVLCKEGFYCPGGSVLGEPCPVGTYNPTTGAGDNSSCLSCPPGEFCSEEGANSSKDKCEAGYWCEGKSSSATPGENPFNNNGPCPVGRYCEKGTKSPALCPAGTLRNVTGAKSVDDCQPCTPGYYCETPGISVATAKCLPRYYCPGNDSNTDPTQYSCPIGYFCEEGSIKPTPCDAGFYQPDIEQFECIECRAGYYCQDFESGDSKKCPPYSYCPPGSVNPTTCPNGTYTSDDTYGLEDPGQCTNCITGKYCTGGKIQDDCAAGFFCLSRSPAPTSSEDFLDVTSCSAEATCAGRCPAGFYCLKGEIDPKACPENTIRETPGASKLEDCSYCPIGKWCRAGDPLPKPCPVGYYCSSMNSSDCNQKAGPQPCPIYTFRNITGGEKKDDCYPCPAGYWCNETGISDYSKSSCALGYYCTGGGQPPTECPAGTFRDTPGATSSDDCPDCTAGFYCPDPSITGFPNIHGVPCDIGYECPTGSIAQIPCVEGYYCPAQTGSAIECPPGYSCINASSVPVKCQYPYYCPGGTGQPLSCDVGYQPLNISDSDLRDTLEKSCMKCPVGSYRNSSEENKCLPCPPGYFCPEGTDNYQEYPCPIGNYCPEGGITEDGGVTGAPIPCPKGTFGTAVGSVSSICQPCPRGTYNNLIGQTHCFQCGSSANSKKGSSECDCIGNNRAFQPSDGACVCKSGYIYYDEVDRLRSEGNSLYSCEMSVDDRCDSEQARRASDRSCILPDEYSCDSACPYSATGGKFDVDRGICLCNEVTFPEDIDCSAGCNTMTTTLDEDTGVLSLTTSFDNSTSIFDVKDVYGPVNKIKSDINTYLVQSSEYGFFATFPTSYKTISSFLNGTLSENIDKQISKTRRKRFILTETEDTPNYHEGTVYFGRRLLQTVDATSAITNATTVSFTESTDIPDNTINVEIGVENPVICLQLNEMILFGVNINQLHRNLSNYPVYLRNHLYNTNENFDYGAFRQLQDQILKSKFPVSKFAHIFITSGIYVFVDAQDNEREMIVNVLPDGQECPDSRIEARTSSGLSKVGVYKLEPQNLKPDYILISVILSIFGFSAIVLFTGIVVWRPVDAGIYPMRKWLPQYRALGEEYYPPYKSTDKDDINKKHNINAVRGVAEGAEKPPLPDEGNILENFNVRTLYDKLEDQNLHIGSQLSHHQNSLCKFYEKINKETEELKNLLNNLDMNKFKDLSMNNATISEENQKSIPQNFNLTDGISQQQQQLLASLEVLIDKLNRGKVILSEEVIEDARKQLEGKLCKNSSTNAVEIHEETSAETKTFSKMIQNENAILEKELVSNESEEICKLLQKHYEERKEVIIAHQEKLEFNLKENLNEEDAEKVIATHEKELENSLEALEKQRSLQMKELKNQLAAKRRQKQLKLKTENRNKSSEDYKDLNAIEKDVESALLDESNLILKKENRSNSSETGVESLQSNLISLLQSKEIPKDIRDKIIKSIIDQDRKINETINVKRDTQISKMREQIARKKQKRLQKLIENQEEKNQNSSVILDEKLLKEQEKEREILEAKLDEEEKISTMQLTALFNQQKIDAAVANHENEILKLSGEYKQDSAAQQEILEHYQKQMKLINEQNSNNLQKQREKMKTKLLARVLKRNLQIQDVSKEQKSVNNSPLTKHFINNQAEENHLHNLKGSSDKHSEVKALLREHQRQLASSKKQHLIEVECLQEDLDKSERMSEMSLKKKFEDELRLKTRELNSKHKAEEASRNDMNKDEAQILFAAHEQELEFLEESLRKDYEKQRTILKEKLFSKRKRKIEELHNRQQVEKQRELLGQQKEVSEIETKVKKETENQEIMEQIKIFGNNESELIIQNVLQQRQIQELHNLTKEFELKKNLQIEEEKQSLLEKQKIEKSNLLAKHQNELLQLEGLSGEEYLKKKSELDSKNKDDLSRLEKRQQKAIDNLSDDINNRSTLDFARAKLKLKEKHYKEFTDSIKKFSAGSMDKNQLQHTDEEIKKINAKKQELEIQREEEERKFAVEKLKLEKEEEKKLKKALQDFEIELQDESEKERKKSEEVVALLIKRREKLIKEKQNVIELDIKRAAAAGASEEEQKRILEQHNKDVKLIENKLDQERMRVRSQLEERLKERKLKRLMIKKNELEVKRGSNLEVFENECRNKMNKIHEKEIEILEDMNKVVDVPVIKSSAKHLSLKKSSKNIKQIVPENIIFETVQKASPVTKNNKSKDSVKRSSETIKDTISEDHLHNMLQSSPLYETLQEVCYYLKHGAKSFGASTSIYADLDKETSDKELIPTPLGSLSVKELVAYKFAVFILSLLRNKRPSHPPVSLLVASSIPIQSSPAKSNPFSGSFSFDGGNGILYIRRSRLTDESIGKLCLLVIHSIAHVTVGDLNDEFNPQFMNEFYHCLAILSDELFFARTTKNHKEKDEGNMTDAANSIIDAKTSSPGLMSRDLINKKANVFERSIAGELANKYLTKTVKPDMIEKGIDNSVNNEAFIKQINQRHPSLIGDAADLNFRDQVNIEFVELAREASHLSKSASTSNSSTIEKSRLQNRLRDVQIKLSNLQERLGTSLSQNDVSSKYKKA